MLVRIKITILLYLVRAFSAKSVEIKSQNEGLPHSQWDSMFQKPSNRLNKCNQLQELITEAKNSNENCVENLESEAKSDLNEFARDEVFPVENTLSSTEFKNLERVLKKDSELNTHQVKLSNGNKEEDINESFNGLDESKQDEVNESSRMDNSLLLQNIESSDRPLERKLPKYLSLDVPSFIFNPGAQPEEQFHNCTTPKNESGRCRYLQHCMIPLIVSSLDTFMGYVCIINGIFIGVCCPKDPATILVIKEQEQHNRPQSDLNKECGIGTKTRIVGGLNADPKAWPWMVALLKSKKTFYCGGALISDLYVLTAAHCTFNVPNNEIIARLGEYDFKDDGNVHDDYAVIEIKRHSHYSRRTHTNDIALLKLEKHVVLNEFIQTICLPEKENSYIGKTATLAGWGYLEGSIFGDGTTSNVLQEANLPVISNEACAESHGMSVPQLLICTAVETADKGACNGDSGGPLMLLEENDRWKVIGLVSWGRRGCSPNFPTVYTRVSHFLEWIKKHSKSESVSHIHKVSANEQQGT